MTRSALASPPLAVAAKLLASAAVLFACVGGPGSLPEQDGTGTRSGEPTTTSGESSDPSGESGSGSAEKGDDGTKPTTCEPGAVSSCKCTGSADGFQVCGEDGKPFGQCICAGVPDAG